MIRRKKILNTSKLFYLKKRVLLCTVHKKTEFSLQNFFFLLLHLISFRPAIKEKNKTNTTSAFPVQHPEQKTNKNKIIILRIIIVFKKSCYIILIMFTVPSDIKTKPVDFKSDSDTKIPPCTRARAHTRTQTSQITCLFLFPLRYN